MANPMSTEATRDAVSFDLGEQRAVRKIASAVAQASFEAASERATGGMELRVLDGVCAGRRLSWGDADTLVVATRGPSFDWSTCAPARDAAAASVPSVGEPDLVLLDMGAPTRVVMSLHMFHASVTVLDGEVWVGDRPVARGARIVLSMYVRLRIGDSIVAFGQNLLGSWPTTAPTPTTAPSTTPTHKQKQSHKQTRTPTRTQKQTRTPVSAAGAIKPEGVSCPDSVIKPLSREYDLARAPQYDDRPFAPHDADHPRMAAVVTRAPPASIPADATSNGEFGPAPLSAARSGRGGNRALRWTGAGFGLALACAAVIWFVAPGAGRPGVPDPSAGLRAELDAGPFRDLTLELREGGRWHLRGRVDSVADRVELERLLSGRGLDVEAEIVVADAIARQGVEPTRGDGKSVDAPAGSGGVDIPVAPAHSAPARMASVVQAKERVPVAPEKIQPVAQVAPPSPLVDASAPEPAASPTVAPAAKTADRQSPESTAATAAKAGRAGTPRQSRETSQKTRPSGQSRPVASVAPPVPAQIPPLSMGLELSTGSRGLLPGEALTFRVKPNRAGHVYCFMQVDTRQVLRLFPNRFQTDSRVGPAGIELPGDVPFKIRMNMNRQTESIACFVTEQDIVARLPGRPGAFDLTPLPVAGLGEVEKAIARLTDGMVAHRTVVMRPL